MFYSFSGNVEVEIDQNYFLQGIGYNEKDFIGLAGAADGAKLIVSNYKLLTEHSFFEVPVAQSIYVDEDGGMSLFLYTDLLVLKPEYRGNGFATQMLKHQIDTARKLNFNSLALFADGGYGEELSGYYIWPRLGFNAQIPQGMVLPDWLQGVQDILDIMSTFEGRKWWKENGIPVSMEFSLDEESKSSKAFNRYLNEKEG